MVFVPTPAVSTVSPPPQAENDGASMAQSSSAEMIFFALVILSLLPVLRISGFPPIDAAQSLRIRRPSHRTRRTEQSDA